MLPVSVVLPLSGKCNLDCIFCIQERTQLDNGLTEMVRNFIITLPKIKNLAFHSWCEPFANNQFLEYLFYCRKYLKDSAFTIVTNGTLLNKRIIDKLITIPPLQISISLNAATETTYYQITGTKLFMTVINNIKYLKNASSLCDNISISISIVLNSYNIKELAKFIQLAKDLGLDHVILYDLIIMKESHRRLSILNNYEESKKYFSEAFQTANDIDISVLSLFPLHYYTNPENWSNNVIPYFCNDPWELFIVNKDGEVFPCCYSNDKMGNIFKNSFNEIWYGSQYEHFRKELSSKSHPQCCKLCPKMIKNLTFESQMHPFLR